ncbi:hypothetical protein [Amycolatopsis sp. NPDC059657]|uniref:hypothetical protein n=1 Tax=Amycolatopsis sp. NPDC059657 TaxID=3346899 RepID=UPI00366EC7BA
MSDHPTIIFPDEPDPVNPDELPHGLFGPSRLGAQAAVDLAVEKFLANADAGDNEANEALIDYFDLFREERAARWNPQDHGDR